MDVFVAFAQHVSVASYSVDFQHHMWYHINVYSTSAVTSAVYYIY